MTCVKDNIRVGIQYIESWLRRIGAVPLYNLMEDVATAEISRARVWQLLKYNIKLDDGSDINHDLLDELINEEMEHTYSEVGEKAFKGARFKEAEELFKKLVFVEKFERFLTLPANKIL